MNRRVFMGHLGLGTLAAVGTAVAQPAPKVARIGILGFAGTTAEMAGPEARRPSVRAFLQGMRELGYVYGRDFVTEPRGGEGRPELWAGQAADLVRLNVDVIVAPGPNLASRQRSTSVIPVVMAASSDPIGEGFVRSLRHPGGNITGLSLQEVDTSGKRLELLEELLPEAAPVALLWTNVSRISLRYLKAAEAAARGHGRKVLKLEIRSGDEIEGAFKAATEAHAGGLLDLAARLTFARARDVATFAARARRTFRPRIQRGLKDLGWVAEQLPALAAELVRLRVDLIVAPSTPTIVAARNATKTIPEVMRHLDASGPPA